MKHCVSTGKGIPPLQPEARLEKSGHIELGLECAHSGLPGTEGCWLSQGRKCRVGKVMGCLGGRPRAGSACLEQAVCWGE